MAETMKDILSQLQTFAKSADESSRRSLAAELRSFAVTLETPNDTIMRVVHSVSLSIESFTQLLLTELQPMELYGAQIGMDLGLFHMLADADKPITAEEIALKKNADPVLIGTAQKSLTCIS
jgi:hypothetical protein